MPEGARECQRRWLPNPILLQDNNAGRVVVSLAPGSCCRAEQPRCCSYPRCRWFPSDNTSLLGTSRRRRRRCSCLRLPYSAAARIAHGISTSQKGEWPPWWLGARIVAARVYDVRMRFRRTHRCCVRPRACCQKHAAADRPDGSVRFSHAFLPRDSCTPTFADPMMYGVRRLCARYPVAVFWKVGKMIFS